jgi:cytochrome c553
MFRRFAIDSLRKGRWVIMKTLKMVTVGAMLAAFFIAMAFMSVTAGTGSEDQFDADASYKAKCVACHGQKAEKKFDVSLPEEQLVDAVMQGKKPEKPPNMPAYGEKGVTAEQAKALVDHMRQLKRAS